MCGNYRGSMDCCLRGILSAVRTFGIFGKSSTRRLARTLLSSATQVIPPHITSIESNSPLLSGLQLPRPGVSALSRGLISFLRAHPVLVGHPHPRSQTHRPAESISRIQTSLALPCRQVNLTVALSIGDDDSMADSGDSILPCYAERDDWGVSHKPVPATLGLSSELRIL